MNASESITNLDPRKLFDWIDYVVFGLSLVLSALIGVYFAFFAPQKQNTTSEYLMGGKTMGIFPISMSLIASYISGISLLGLPAEMYVYGTQYWMIVCSEIVVSFTIVGVYLPVFYTLQITSSYEYLKLRFSSGVRLLGSVIFLVKMLLYIPMVIYVPALAFSQATGANLHLITPIVCIVCIFYTTLGGLKAVVWTDTLQTILMFAGVIIVMVLGTINVGGIDVVIERSRDSERLEFFVFDLDPTIRHTFWSVLVGNYFSWLAACSVNQAMMQRCLAMPTRKKANITVIILAAGILAIVTMSCYTGLVIYASFYDCDPVSTKSIGKADQLLPFFVMEISKNIPGLPGLFISGVFSAALSSMSTGLNSMTGVLFEDLIRPRLKTISEARASFIMKIIVVVIGTVCVGLVFLVEKMGTLIQAGKSLAGITAGSLLGIFSLGMFFPWANSKGALVGGLTSFTLVGWISLGTQAAIATGHITFPKKPISVEGCVLEYDNSTLSLIPEFIRDEPFALYRMSYLWYTALGTSTAIIVGLIVSFLTGPNDPKNVDPKLLTPVIHRFLPTKMRRREVDDGQHKNKEMDNLESLKLDLKESAC
ncbi:sodium-coupled monocarboxylate transporter 2 [Anabrus simplex]|uniref:sodium-coupled monocarboxylate transporter 2 n=1 Tax=Anabrus simplex TaxID=316456 RepID=UPI0035A3792E